MKLLQNIFSITNENKKNKIFKVITVLGFKIKIFNSKLTCQLLDKNLKNQKEKFLDEIKDLKRLIYKYCSESNRKIALEDWYFERTGELLNLENPQTFNEKIQWLKLYDSTPLKTRLADKYLVRDWVKEKIGEEYLIPLLGVWDKFEDIDFDKLPNQFVLKCNHGCGYNIIVKDKYKLNFNETKIKINKWLNENYAFHSGFEMQYSDIPRKIIAEEYIEAINSSAPIDYKFICCNGKPKLCWVTNKSLKIHERSFYDLPEWNFQKIEYKDGGAILATTLIEKPKNLDKMLEICKILSQGFPVVRVDLYLIEDKIYFGEMTFTSSTGIAKFSPDEWNYLLGDAIPLPNKD